MTYEELREVCQFGDRPVEGKVVIQYAGMGYAHERYRIVSNPLGLTIQDIALFCGGGHLPFGWRSSGGVLCIHTD